MGERKNIPLYQDSNYRPTLGLLVSTDLQKSNASISLSSSSGNRSKEWAKSRTETTVQTAGNHHTI